MSGTRQLLKRKPKKKKKKKKEFIAAGNLDKAKAQAQDVIKDFIQSVYGNDVVVQFEDK